MKNLPETTTTDIVIAEPVIEALTNQVEVIEETVAPKARDLDFTVIHGYLRGDHACAYEVHATGCKDLRSKQARNLFSYNVYAPTGDAARDQAVEDLPGSSSKDFWIQPCTGLKRMKAIGRA